MSFLLGKIPQFQFYQFQFVPSLWALTKGERSYCQFSCKILQFCHYIMAGNVWENCQAKLETFAMYVWVREDQILKCFVWIDPT